MLASEIARQRLYRQGVSRPVTSDPVEVVRRLGAVQAQDYYGAKWAVGQRTAGVNDAGMDEVFGRGDILRTHVLRPTWHFVTPEDIRWMLALTAPRVHALNGTYYRKMELDDAIFAASEAALAAALQGGNFLTRPEITAMLHRAKIATDDLRFVYLLMHAELEGLICSGPRRGKQFTYALLDERAPQAKHLARDEALAELTLRYFSGHGPATAHDMTWWSGLTLADARAGIEMVKARLEHEVIEGKEYWFVSTVQLTDSTVPVAFLLPNYDESIASYQDRSAAVDPIYTQMWDRGNAIFSHHVVIDGQIIGSWQRTLSKRAVTVEVRPFRTLSTAEAHAVAVAASRYGEFLGLPLVLQLLPVQEQR